ncbi:hypothetical protein [Streptomyces sp. NPDC047130]|uniref:hypothetical protein n=1 Tax=Streptomyces sp. NPDC047130 TaxID=3155261 RepID=UPI0033DD3A58
MRTIAAKYQFDRIRARTPVLTTGPLSTANLELLRKASSRLLNFDRPLRHSHTLRR